MTSSQDPIPGGARSARPNVLVIHADQHRRECLGAYGNREIRTPHLDNLARDGVRYDNCFCPFPVCTPSRYSLLSGLYVHEHRGAANRSTMLPGTPTFASVLAGAGYRTRAVGKMHLTPTYCDVGFQEMFLAEQDGLGRWDDDYHRWLRDRGLVDVNDLEDQERTYREQAPAEYWEAFGALPSNLPEECHSTTWIGDRALEALDGWGPGGNLLMVGFIKPHHPFDPPHPWAGMYDPRYLTLLPGWTDEVPPQDAAYSQGYFADERLSKDSLRRVMAHYYATISQVDFQVGRLLEALKRRGLYEDTMVVYTSDHGDYMGFHHRILKGNHLYDPLARVPLLVKWPRQTTRGLVSGRLASIVDVAPTILCGAGLPPAPAMSGLDLAGNEERDVVFCQSNGGELMARTARHKLLLNHRQPERSLLFDLVADPTELDNLYDEPTMAPLRAELTARLREWLPQPDYPPHVRVDALTIDQANAREGAARRDEIMAYYDRAMRSARSD